MTHKAVGFDRSMPEADFDSLDMPSGSRQIMMSSMKAIVTLIAVRQPTVTAADSSR